MKAATSSSAVRRPNMKHYYVVTHYHGKARKSSSPFKTRKAAERWAKICQAGAPMSLTYEIVSEEA